LPSRPRFSAAAAPIEKPIPLWILYPLFFAGLYAAHWPLLRLPYFWDEAGYYIPAALDFFRTRALIPHSTLTNAHPPLPSILLSGWWYLAGTTISGTRTFLLMLAAAALLGVFRLARTLAGTPVAAAVTFLTAIYPIWFAQSSLAHADLFAATFTLWALSVYFERFAGNSRPTNSRLALIALLFALAALSKETAIITPICLALWEVVLLATAREDDARQASLPSMLALLTPIIPLALWYAYHRHQTGFLFGNPEFLRYNATANLSVVRVLTSLWHRAIHLVFHMNLWVPALITVAMLLSPKLRRADDETAHPILTSPVLKTLLVLVLGNLFEFSVLGGALLTRYLLPIYPLEILVCVALWQQRLKQWPALVAFTAVAFLAALFINPPYSIAPEDNLTYRDMIVLHQQAVSIIATQFPHATVLTAWPATAELEHPDLGYIHHPVKVDPIENFAFDQIQKAAADPGGYDTALVFSTKWIPPAGLPNFGLRTESIDTRFYDFHRDLTPHEIATLLHGDIVWQREHNGEWAAVLRFPRVVEARVR
jgi:4-amino-4-deoxy-L-arabinose transferase-like glycosyltransferase